MTVSRESLKKMSLEQLEGRLSEAKAKFVEASTQLSEARQAQILKTKQIKGKAAKRKKELIAQIVELEKQTAKVQAQTRKVAKGEQLKFEAQTSKASAKVRQRAQELKQTGSYRTSLSDYEKILSWCRDMGVDKDTLEELLNTYSLKELAHMSGDDFYDEVQSISFKTILFSDDDGEDLGLDSIFF